MAKVLLEIQAKDQSSRAISRSGKQLDSLDKKSKKATGSLKNLSRSGLGESIQQFTGFRAATLGAVGGLTALVGGLAKATADTVRLGSELVDLSAKTGLSVQQLQEFKFAAEQTGVGFEQITQSVQRLGRRAANELPEAVKGLEAIGLASQDILKLSPGDAFQLVVDKLAQVPNEAEQAGAAMQIFGDAGLQITGLINQGLEENIERFRELDVAMSDETALAAKQLSDQLTDLDARWTDVKTTIGGAVIPALQGLLSPLDAVKDVIRLLGAFALNFSADFVEVFSSTMPAAIAKFLDVLALIPGQGGAAVTSAADAVRNFGEEGKRLAETMREDATAALLEVTASASETADKLAGVGEEAKKTAEAVSTELTPALNETEDGLDRAVTAASGLAQPLEIQRRTSVALGQAVKEYEFNLSLTERRILEFSKANEEAADTNRAFGDSMQEAADFARIFDGTLGSIVSQLGGLGGGLRSLFGSGGGIGSLFAEASSAAGGGILGAISGIANIAGPIGAIAGPAIEALTSIFGGPDIKGQMRDIGRDIGVQVSEGLAEQIAESGENAQFFLREIFEEGNLGIDELAREVGDLFSFFERGEISEAGLIGELKETLPILIQNFDDLGPAGQEQIGRIAAAAERLGISLGEINELIQQGFAPDTVEQMAEEFDLTNQEVRELAKELGVNVQTSLERAAAQAGLTVDEFRKLQEELGERLGTEGPASIEEVTALLESMGVTAEEAAAKLGLDVAGGSETAAAAQQLANEKLQLGVNFAAQLRDNLLAAAEASRGIQAPTGGGGGGGNGPPTFNAQHGADLVTGSRGAIGFFHPNERVIAIPGGGGAPRETAAPGPANVTVNVTLPPGAPADQANQIADLLERNVAGLRGRAAKSLGVE